MLFLFICIIKVIYVDIHVQRHSWEDSYMYCWCVVFDVLCSTENVRGVDDWKYIFLFSEHFCHVISQTYTLYHSCVKATDLISFVCVCVSVSQTGDCARGPNRTLEALSAMSSMKILVSLTALVILFPSTIFSIFYIKKNSFSDYNVIWFALLIAKITSVWH